MRVGIIGGGITGLAASFFAEKAGAEATVFESDATLGGLATSFDFGPFHWDKFYHCILTSDRYLLSLLDELGLASELRWKETRTGFYSKHGLHSMSNSLEFLFFPPLSLWEKLRLGLGILYAAGLRELDGLEEITACEWLRRVFGRGNYEKVWAPLLNSKLGACREEASAAWIWATIFRYYSTREKRKAKKEVMGYVRGGYRTVFQRLIERLRAQGTQLMLSAPVNRIEPAAGGRVRVYACATIHEFDRVLFTGPSNLLARVTPGLDHGYAAKLLGVKYLGVVCVVLLLKRALSRFYITNLLDPNLPFTGIIEMTSLISLEETSGRHLVYLPKYTVPGDPLFSRTDEEIAAQMIAGLLRVHPELDQQEIEKLFVFRARYVQPVPVLRYSHLLPSMETNIPGLFLANSTFIVNGTLNNNEMVRIARSAVEKLLGVDPGSGGTEVGPVKDVLQETPEAGTAASRCVP